ncbi:MAG TPA: 4Fe-4S dicluster domain-containing protein [Candidatus Nanopelagicales bacterium]|nr:4Fe-4S dicluster domain-containing protein [Candidatus Nanopelagicales bacterium]
MTSTTTIALDRTVLPAARLDLLFDALRAEGWPVLGPTLRDGVIGIGPLRSAADLPRGWGDEQDAGSYRLVRRDDDAFFGYAAPAGTWKRYLFPARSVLWRARVIRGAPIVEEAIEDVGRRALLGIRGCDLAAVHVQDRVLLHGAHPDPVYSERRKDLLLVGVACGTPASTCFCPSMGTGPGVGDGADIALTELEADDPRRHRFLVEPRTPAGAAVVAHLPEADPDAGDDEAAQAVVAGAARRITRGIDAERAPAALRAGAESSRWDDVASRCLSCGSCTMVCPTCFCTDVRDEPDVLAGVDERVRVWASCFELGHSYLHGGAVRPSPSARYRQWATHKFSTWWDQFGTSGCVGCGRCIAWCPAGIDVTEEVRAVTEEAGT